MLSALQWVFCGYVLSNILIRWQVMTLIFTTISSAADYGDFGRWLLFVLTCICWAAQFACVSLTSMFD